MKRAFFLNIVGVLLLTTLGMQCARKATDPIRIYGSTTIGPFMNKAAAEYTGITKTRFVIKSVGSRDGIDSLIAGSCDIAMSSMEITPDEINRAKQQKTTLKTYLLGYDIIIPIVHPSNKTDNISFDNLKRVWAGEIRSWTPLGGPDTDIDVVDRSDASGTYSVWHHEVVPPHDTATHFTVLASNSAVLAYVAGHAHAIGYVSASFLNPDVKPLMLDGIAIIENDSLLADYHLKRPLYLYVNEDRFSGEVRQFLMFLLIDERGRALLHKQGFFSSFSLAPLFNSVEKMSKR